MTAQLPLARTVAVVALVTVGSFFLLVGTVGLLRLPDVYNRMHATSKATTLGAASMFLAGAVYFGPQGAGLTSLVAILFLFATAPTGAHVISRAAQKMGIPFFGEAFWPDPGDRPDEPVEGGETVEE
jgi:multicomponent Na+:H+ antiporter subunit G